MFRVLTPQSCNNWTSITDFEIDDKLTIINYFKIEEAFCNIAQIYFEEKRVNSITNKKIEKNVTENEDRKSIRFLGLSSKDNHVLNTIDCNAEYDMSYLISVVKLALREFFWCEIHSKGKKEGITFGYDYYMYLITETLGAEIISYAASKDIIIEKNDNQLIINSYYNEE